MRCISCNSKINNRKRKPATTFAGSMNSVFTDLIEGFPKHEEEDLCNTCLGSIRNYSSDLNDSYNIDNHLFVSSSPDAENMADEYSDRVDGAFEYTEEVYQGYRDK